MARNPMERYRIRRGWTQHRASLFFHVSYSTYRQRVNGFRGVSLRQAEKEARRSRGDFTAQDMRMWHVRNDRRATQ